MLKFPKKSQKGSATILIRNFLRATLFFALLFLIACAGRPPQPTIHVPLENPMRFTGATPDADFNRAYADYESGNLKKARKEFEKEIKDIPNHFPSYLGIAYTYLAEKDYPEAEKYVRISLEIRPDYPQGHFALAHLFEQQQDYDSALKELDQVAQLNPEYPTIQESRNVMKLKATEMHITEADKVRDTDPDLALKHLKAAQELAPEMSELPIQIAMILVKQNNCSDAVPYLQTAVEKSPENMDAKRQLADCFSELQDYKQALPLYEELATQHPEDTELRAKLETTRKRVYIEGLPEEYQEIPRSAQITRAQFAALVMINLDYLQKYSTGSSQILTDSINHWAKNFILKVVDLGIIDPYPNRMFQPETQLTRLELAKAASRILEIASSRRHVQLPNGANQTIPDVPNTSLYYAMIAKALSAGLLTLDADGNFHPGRSVSGAEALSLINRIEQISE